MSSQTPTSIKALFQSITPEAMSVIRGEVISDAPLQIKAVNDDKLVLSGNNLCVPRHLTDYMATADIEVTGPAAQTDTVDAHKHNVVSFSAAGATITVHNALKTGDMVYILSYNHGKKYYVFDREP